MLLFAPRHKTQFSSVMTHALQTLFRRLVRVVVGGAAIVAPFAHGQQPQYECRAEGDQFVCREVEPLRSPLVGKAPTVTTTTGSAAAVNPGQDLDWVPYDQLSPEQQAALGAGCCGMYVNPRENEEGADIPPDQAPVEFSAGGGIEGKPNERLELKDGVVITNGSLQLKGDSAELDELNNTASIRGDVSVRDRNVLLRGSEVSLDRNTNTATMSDGRFVLYEQSLRGEAGQLSSGDDILVLENGEFTRCEPGNNNWLMRGSSITIDSNTQQGVARNVRIELGGVPVFYSPYLRFPTGGQRQSGFLFPSISGEELSIPYYINLAPNYDLIVAPGYVAERGDKVELQFRHLSPLFETTISGAYLPNGRDSFSDNEEGALEDLQADPTVTQAEIDLFIADATEFDDEDRWLGRVQQEGGEGRAWYSRIDYQRVSDFAYFNQVNTSNLEVSRSSQLPRFGEVGYVLPNWLMNVRWEESQTIARDVVEPYRLKPQLFAEGDYEWGDIQLKLTNNFTQFRHRQDFFDQDTNPTPNDRRIIGDRLRLDYELSLDKNFIFGFVRPRVLLKHVSYSLDEDSILDTAESDPSATVPQFTLDMGLFFEREGSWFGNSYLQTFEPRIFYFYSDFEDQSDFFDLTARGRDITFDTSELRFGFAQLFRDTRFSGGDRIDDARQISVGLTTRFLSAETGIERFSASVGQIYYLNDRRVTLNNQPLVQSKSEIAGQFAARITNNLQFVSDVQYDTDDNVVTQGNASFRYVSDDYKILNLGYRFNRRDPVLDPISGDLLDVDQSQGDISFIWPVYGNLSVIGRQLYDFNVTRSGKSQLDTLFGFEYNNCCYRFRLVSRRNVDEDLINRVVDEELEFDRGLLFEIQLKGLSTVGRKVSNTLSEGVFNYDQREVNLFGANPDDL